MAVGWLTRKRSYLYLARDFDPVLKRISAEASARAAKGLWVLLASMNPLPYE
jgi:hypothetical protein